MSSKITGILTNAVYMAIQCVVSVIKYVELATRRWSLNQYLRGMVDDALRKGTIIIDGPESHHPQVKNKDEFYNRIIENPSLGIGECYMEGHWDCEDVEEFLHRIFIYEIVKEYMNPINKFINFLLFKAVNLQTKQRAWEVGEKHYDLGNELFESFLDPTLNYSCGYWKDASNLDEAQLAKMDLIGRKLKLSPGMKVLDIGCGWGGLCKYLAENYRVSVVGCTISVEQAKTARERCANLPVDIRLQDYRDLEENEKFDRIVSVGMFEHVGTSNYKTFFKVANKCLKDDGIFLLHTIGVSHPWVPLIESWFHKYIFPNGILPYHTDILKKTDGLFILEDWHNLGINYTHTLRAWKENFVRNWPKLKAEKNLDHKFYRMWTYYLSLSAAAFRSRKFQVWQVVLSKDGVIGGYDSSHIAPIVKMHKKRKRK